MSGIRDETGLPAQSRYRLELPLPPGDLWVFGYGSLMWDPGFEFLEMRTATLFGWHRAFCVRSIHWRGTPERPGLVLGLDQGGSCRGRAYRVAEAIRQPVVDYLFRREMISGVYTPRILAIHPDGLAPVKGLTFVADRSHVQYAGKLSPEQTAELVCQGSGARGPCRDYLVNTIRHLDELGIPDGPLHRVLDLVRMKG